MKVQEIEEKITTKLAGLEDQETRLQEWLECIRQVGDIAEKMGYARLKSEGDEGSLMKAFEELMQQAEVEENEPETAEVSPETQDDNESVEQSEPELDEVELADTSVKVDPAQDPVREDNVPEVPDQGPLDQLRESLNRSKPKKTTVKNRFGALMSSLFSPEED